MSSVIELEAVQSHLVGQIEHFFEDDSAQRSGPPGLARIAFGKLETYVEHLKARGNSLATIHKKMRYLRGAFNKAVRRSYLAKNPMDGWSWEREDGKPPRVLTDDEESGLLEATGTKYGYRW